MDMERNRQILVEKCGAIYTYKKAPFIEVHP